MRVVSVLSSNFGQWITQSYFPNVSDSSLNMWSYYINPFFSVWVCVHGNKTVYRAVTECQNHPILSVLVTLSRPRHSLSSSRVTNEMKSDRGRFEALWHNKITRDRRRSARRFFFFLIWHPVVCAAKKANPSGCWWRLSKWERMWKGGGSWIVNKQITVMWLNRQTTGDDIKVIELSAASKSVNLRYTKSCTSSGASSSAVVPRGCTIIPNLITRRWIKAAPTYEGFLAGLHVLLRVELY